MHLSQCVFAAQKAIIEEFWFALLHPSSQLIFNGIVIEFLSTEIVFQGAKHVEVRKCEVGAVWKQSSVVMALVDFQMFAPLKDYLCALNFKSPYNF